jgi:hypothetical protein
MFWKMFYVRINNLKFILYDVMYVVGLPIIHFLANTVRQSSSTSMYSMYLRLHCRELHILANVFSIVVVYFLTSVDNDAQHPVVRAAIDPIVKCH